MGRYRAGLIGLGWMGLLSDLGRRPKDRYEIDDVDRPTPDLVVHRKFQYARKSPAQPHRRWGKQKGWVYLGDQKLPIEVPRVRDTATGVEVPLDVYKALQNPRELDEGMLPRVLKGISCRNYGASRSRINILGRAVFFSRKG